MGYWTTDDDTYRLFMTDVCVYKTALGGWKVVGGKLDGMVFDTLWKAQQAAEQARPSYYEIHKDGSNA